MQRVGELLKFIVTFMDVYRRSLPGKVSSVAEVSIFNVQ